MTRRERGATVGVMWLIMLIVMLLAAGGWIYSREGEFQDLQNALASAQRDRKTFEDDLTKTTAELQNLSTAVGFRGDPNAAADLGLIKNYVSDLKSRYPNNLGADDKTLQDVTSRLASMYDDQVAQTKDAHAQWQSELASRSAAEGAKNEIESTLNSANAQVNVDLRDERDRAQNQKSQDDARAAALEGQLNESTAQRRQLESEFTSQKAAIQKEKDRAEGRIVELADKIKLAGIEEAPNDPDGNVIAVGTTTGLVYIDIGAKDLLRRGVRFDVFRRIKGGYLVHKGSVEVREVNADSAVCGIISQSAALDPIAPGDVVANPLFSKDREKVFALVGNFPVYGRNFLEKRLRDLGAEVSSDVSPHVDFVILGEKAPEEDAVDVTELPGFKLAQQLNIQMLRLQDIDRFLKP